MRANWEEYSLSCVTQSESVKFEYHENGIFSIEKTKLFAVDNSHSHSRDHLSSTLADHEELLVEHDQLASRHEQLLRESEEAKENMQRQLKTEEARHSIQRQEQSELISQLRQEIEDVTNAFKNQLHSLQEDHHKVAVFVWIDAMAAADLDLF